MDYVLVIAVWFYLHQAPVEVTKPMATLAQCNQAAASFRIGNRELFGVAYCRPR